MYSYLSMKHYVALNKNSVYIKHGPQLGAAMRREVYATEYLAKMVVTTDQV